MGRSKGADGLAARVSIMDWMAAYRAERGFYPTQTEIIEGLGMSKGAFLWHLNSLVEQGFVTYLRKDFARTVRLSRRSRATLR